MLKHLGTSLRMTIVSVVLFGLIYPLAMTGAAQVLFPKQANGEIVTVHGKPVGSWIIGQLWTQPRYFQGRPSAAGKGYDPTNTGGTNYGATSAKLIKSTQDTVKQLEKDNPDASGPPPMDLITSSASGIDPDISPEAAYWEAPRIAKARHMAVDDVRAIVARYVQNRTFGILGEPHVNVLELNLALDGIRPD
ncbi:MAG: potassium-transporting ATPase subunit KdpC [Candidatus Eremiobacteraeota bacterium]|nr:potassium-transporting ATPase subunit KdpC [Candidatus Eremiobacteraeota bacterium]